jgi:hypothetical protein
MNMTSKPGTELRGVVPAERYLLHVCPSAGALLPPPGPSLRSGWPKKALRASRAEQRPTLRVSVWDLSNFIFQPASPILEPYDLRVAALTHELSGPAQAPTVTPGTVPRARGR